MRFDSVGAKRKKVCGEQWRPPRPAFEEVGPYASYAGYSAFSKIILTLTMMPGRLEILPVLILFSPKTWKRV